MTEQTKLLVPLRYPLTEHSTRTLAYAQQLASNAEEKDAHLFILYVNIFQRHDNVQEAEIRRAIAPLLNEVPFTVLTRGGFLVEEEILDEAQNLNADSIIVGENQRPWWQRIPSRLLGNDMELVRFLHNNTEPNVEVETVG